MELFVKKYRRLNLESEQKQQKIVYFLEYLGYLFEKIWYFFFERDISEILFWFKGIFFPKISNVHNLDFSDLKPNFTTKM